MQESIPMITIIIIIIIIFFFVIVLQALIEKGEKSTLICQEMSDKLAECCVFLVRCSQQISDCTDSFCTIFCDNLKAFFTQRSCALSSILFKSLLQLCWVGNWKLAPLLVDYAFDPTLRKYRRGQALELLKVFFNNHRLLRLEEFAQERAALEKKLAEKIAKLNEENWDLSKNAKAALKVLAARVGVTLVKPISSSRRQSTSWCISLWPISWGTRSIHQSDREIASSCSTGSTSAARRLPHRDRSAPAHPQTAFDDAVSPSRSICSSSSTTTPRSSAYSLLQGQVRRPSAGAHNRVFDSHQLSIIMIGKQAMNSILEMCLPLFWKLMNTLRLVSRRGRGDELTSPSSSSKYMHLQWVRDCKLVEWGPRSLLPEYLEMVL
ncbi:unnamed protein product [Trichogramma brassicae]|uniref:Uncharacterized protein n=1 Tax=Trichogramma brassicae TaxID=86971 RepID=A0A6H5II31_9HYME|nr:unnamed protein product [Trichogramma brassicae]